MVGRRVSYVCVTQKLRYREAVEVDGVKVSLARPEERRERGRLLLARPGEGAGGAMAALRPHKPGVSGAETGPGGARGGQRREEMGLTKEIALTRIIADSDRGYGGDGDIGALAESLRRHGMINPVLVREEAGGGGYRLIAGRRRVKAAGMAGMKKVPATVLGPEEAEAAGELALAENVNRLDMDPLDEAETFAGLLAKGEEVKEIALRYERSPSAIYQRARLAKLSEGLKGLFHGGKLTLSQAAVLAGFDGEEQEAFLKEHGKKAKISSWHINAFLYERQHCRLEGIADGECEGCGKRTHNTDPQLFEDYQSYGDVCFDEKCWKRKWEGRLYGMIAETRKDAPGVNAVIFEGVFEELPEFFEEMLTVKEGEKRVRLNGEEFRVLCEGEYEEAGEGEEGGVEAVHIQEWSRLSVTLGRFIKTSDADLDRERGRKKIKLAAFIPDLPEAEAEALEEAVSAKYGRLGFEWAVQDRLLENYVRFRGESGKEPGAGVIDEYFRHPNTNAERVKKLYAAYTGKKFSSYSKAFKENAAAAVFFILRASSFGSGNLPDGEEMRDAGVMKGNNFMKFSGLGMEEYQVLYHEAARQVAEEAGREEGN
jgi:ParB/RepB/Spo0J family partition protein